MFVVINGLEQFFITNFDFYKYEMSLKVIISEVQTIVNDSILNELPTS